MKRSDVKADGTIYTDGYYPIRIVETGRLWDKGLGRMGATPYIRPSIDGRMSSSTHPNGYVANSFTGFLAVRGNSSDDGMADLQNLDIRTESIGDHVWLNGWKDSLPKTLRVVIIIPRALKGTWDDIQARRQVETDRMRAECERRNNAEAKAFAAYLEAETRLEAHGLWGQRHVPTLGVFTSERVVTPEGYVTVKASELIELLDRLDPQTFLNAAVQWTSENYGAESGRSVVDALGFVSEYLNKTREK